MNSEISTVIYMCRDAHIPSVAFTVQWYQDISSYEHSLFLYKKTLKDKIMEI